MPTKKRKRTKKKYWHSSYYHKKRTVKVIHDNKHIIIGVDKLQHI